MDFNLNDLDFDFDIGEFDETDSKNSFARVKRYITASAKLDFHCASWRYLRRVLTRLFYG